MQCVRSSVPLAIWILSVLVSWTLLISFDYANKPLHSRTSYASLALKSIFPLPAVNHFPFRACFAYTSSGGFCLSPCPRGYLFLWQCNALRSCEPANRMTYLLQGSLAKQLHSAHPSLSRFHSSACSMTIIPW